MNEHLYTKLLQESYKREFLAEEGLYKGESFYRFDGEQDCQICSYLDGMIFSADNPDLIRLSVFLDDNCVSDIDLLTYLDIEYCGGMERVRECDAFLHRLLKNSPYIFWPYYDGEKHWINKTPCKIALKEMMTIFRQQYEVLDSIALPHYYTAYEFYTWEQHSECKLCSLLEGLYIAEDNPNIDKVIDIMSPGCKIFLRQRDVKDNVAGQKKLKQDKAKINKAIAEYEKDQVEIQKLITRYSKPTVIKPIAKSKNKKSK